MYKSRIKKIRDQILASLFYLMTSTVLFGESMVFERISINDGLSQSTIHSIFQDRLGLIWFGTYDGLNVYDGYRFIIFRYNRSDPDSLSHNNIYPIYEDSYGIFWIGTGGGLNQLNRDNNTFTHYRYDPLNKNSISSDTVYSILEDSQGILWIGTDKGLNTFNRDSRTFTNYRNAHQPERYLNNHIINVMIEDSRQRLWIGTDQGLYQYIPSKSEYVKFQQEPGNINSISDNCILSLYEDHEKKLWIGTEKGGLNKFIEEKHHFFCYKYSPVDPLSISNNQIRSINEDYDNRLWIATNEGLNRFDQTKNMFIHYLNDPQDDKSLNNNLVRYLYKDRSGILWIGTLNGITAIKPQYKKIKTYSNNIGNKNSLSHNYIRSLYHDTKKNIWIGTRGGGLNQYNPVSKKYTQYQHDPDNQNSISSNNIKGICEDNNGNFWIGTAFDGLNKYIPAKDIFIRFMPSVNNLNSISSNEISVLWKDRQGMIWIGTNKGLNRLDPENNRFICYQYKPGDTQSLSDNTITAIYEDWLGNLWIGTNKGLNKFDRDQNRFQLYLHDPDNRSSLSDSNISAITGDSAGNLWIGTINGGLNRLDIKTGQFTCYTLKDGLVNECIYAVQIDNAGSVWFSSNLGISQLNPLTHKFRHFDVNDGLQSNEFNADASLKTSQGELFFGGVNGLNSFFPDEIKDNPVIPVIVITSLNCGGVKTDYNIKPVNVIKLGWQQNFFEIEFSALNYIGTQKNQYAYFLEGFDKQWNNSKTRRFASYTNLPGGHYSLHIIGSNNDNQWNQKGISIAVSVSAPPWKRWWAYLLYFLVPLSILFMIIRYFFIQKTHLLFKQFTINIAHEIKTPLTLMSNYMDKYIKKHQNDPDLLVIQKNLNKLKNDMIHFFNTESLEMGKVIYHHDQIINIKAILMDKLLIFNELFSANHLTVEQVMSETDLFIKMDPAALDEVLNNLLENSIKYNKPAGSVTVTLYEKDGQIILKVSDTGIGINRKNLKYLFNRYYQVIQQKQSIQGIGLGLYIAKKIIEEVQGKILVESEIDIGTSFTILFPRQQQPESSAHHLPEYKKNIPVLSYTGRSNAYIHQQWPQQYFDDNKYTLLIVEDNPELLSYLISELSTEYNIFYGINGTEALRRIDKINKPDLIISDIMMDVMDGYEFYDHLIKNKKYHSVPFVFLSAKTGIENHLFAMGKGAVDFIEKPFSIEILKLKIASLIDLQISKELDILENFDHYKKKKIIELFKQHQIIPSEQELIILAIQGNDNHQISSRLNIAYNSVKTYFYRIYKKCDVKNRIELMKLFNLE